MFDNISTKQILNNKFFKSLSLQQQYTLYSLLLNNKDPKFVVYTYVLLTSFFKSVQVRFNTNYLVCYYVLSFFLKKTFLLHNIFFIGSERTEKDLHQPDLVKKLFKWRTGKNVESTTDFFLNRSNSILTKYSDFRFIESLNTTLFVQTGLQLVDNGLVFLSKPLLSKPLYSSSSINKYLSTGCLNTFEFQFLRKNKVYNKGRYSRCRQNYRTGVYMCMYLSVVSIFGLYFWFYKFSFNFTYLWWFFISFVASFFVPKIIKYRLYEPSTLFNSFLGFFKWTSLIVKSLFFK